MAESLRKGADGPARVTPSAGARARDVSRDVDAETAGIRAWLEARDAETAPAGDPRAARRPGTDQDGSAQAGSGRPESS
jgi:hypothetical protein